MYLPKSTIIIPSLDPDRTLVEYIQSLIDQGFQHIIIVNDGSQPKCSEIFLEIEKKPECIVLRHDINRGKGRSIKTAMKYYMANMYDSTGVITVDADGQHAVNDVLRINDAMNAAAGKVILGSRDFSGEHIPFKSKFGNKVTSRIIQIFHGHYFSDTQTGLRGFPNALLESLTNKVAGERYEYEMNVLLYCVHRGIEVEEMKIETIYHDEDNSGSHFRPFIDSLRIYAVILKSFFFYSLSGILSALLDLAIFTLVVKLVLKNSDAAAIFTATIAARACSSIFNYAVNKNVVFRSKSRVTNTVIKYYLLCAVQMSASAGLVYFFHHFSRIDEILVKAVIDGLLFFASYQVQKRWVFRPSRRKGGNSI